MQIYVASTFADLSAHRDAVRSAILSIDGSKEYVDYQFVGPDYLDAHSQFVPEATRKQIEDSFLVVLIVGWQYGYLLPGEGISVTELEYDLAARSTTSILVYIIDDRYPIPAKFVETGESADKLRHFKERLRRERIVKTFTTPDDLARQVAIDVTYSSRRSMSEVAEDIIARPHLEQELSRCKQASDGYQATVRALQARLDSVVPASPIWARRNFSIDTTLCFALMPFQDSFFRIYEESILPAARAAGLRCTHAGEIFDNREIIEDVWESICTARLVIADVTGRNPNVFYELGICHTLGKEVVVVTQEAADVPFDIRHRRYLVYESDKLVSLKGRLEKTITNVLVRSGGGTGT